MFAVARRTKAVEFNVIVADRFRCLSTFAVNAKECLGTGWPFRLGVPGPARAREQRIVSRSCRERLIGSTPGTAETGPTAANLALVAGIVLRLLEHAAPPPQQRHALASSYPCGMAGGGRQNRQGRRRLLTKSATSTTRRTPSFARGNLSPGPDRQLEESIDRLCIVIPILLGRARDTRGADAMDLRGPSVLWVQPSNLLHALINAGPKRVLR
jgi:hypothetical protein